MVTFFLPSPNFPLFGKLGDGRRRRMLFADVILGFIAVRKPRKNCEIPVRKIC